MMKPLRITLMILTALLLLCSCRQEYDPAGGKELFSGAGGTISVPSSKAKVIVLSGQSNAAGITFVSELPKKLAESYSRGFDNIMLLVENGRTGNSSDTFVRTTTGWGDSDVLFGPEVGMADMLSRLWPDETFYIIKYAFSGAPLAGEFAVGRTCYNALCSTIDKGLGILKDQGLDPQIIAFCWMQGETDSCYEEMTAAYAENERNMFTELRNAYGQFLILDAGISQTWPRYDQINTAKRDNCLLLDRCEFINTIGSGLKVSDFDLAHYNSSSMIRLGNLFASRIAEHVKIGE